MAAQQQQQQKKWQKAPSFTEELEKLVVKKRLSQTQQADAETALQPLQNIALCPLLYDKIGT